MIADTEDERRRGFVDQARRLQIGACAKASGSRRHYDRIGESPRPGMPGELILAVHRVCEVAESGTITGQVESATSAFVHALYSVSATYNGEVAIRCDQCERIAPLRRLPQHPNNRWYRGWHGRCSHSFCEHCVDWGRQRCPVCFTVTFSPWRFRAQDGADADIPEPTQELLPTVPIGIAAWRGR